MGKKNKKKNTLPVNKPQTETQQQESSVVDNSVVTEYLATEEGKATTKEIEEYVAAKKQEADKYYEDKKNEADKIVNNAEETIQKKVNAEVKQKEKEMQEQIAKAQKEANTQIKEEKEKLTEREEKLNKNEEEVTKKMYELEQLKDSYIADINKDIQNKLNELGECKSRLKKQEAEIKSLEEDNEFLKEELSNNAIKRNELKGFELEITKLQSDIELINKKYNELKEEKKYLKEQILEYGDDPKAAISENVELKKQIETLESRLGDCPSEAELEDLRNNAHKVEELNNKLEKLQQEKLNLEMENNTLKVNNDEIESYRKFIKILELQKSELKKELDRNIELYSNKTEKVFASLSLIDKEPVNEYPAVDNINLKTLCERFRGYLANRPNNPLYYEEKTIRTFIAGFASSRIMILEGLSGTGKSSLPRAFADFMGSKTIEVPVQSSWTDRNDLLGFYNDFKKQYKETEFLKALYKATHDRKNIYVIVLDEMNLSRIEYYFADFLSVLEKPNVDDWKIELISDYASITQNDNAWPELINEGKIQICDNTWFVGTANKDDSTAIITDKVYDRSVVYNFEKKGEKTSIPYSGPIEMSNEQFQKLLRNASKFKDEANETRYKTMLRDLDENIKSEFQITFGNRIANQLAKFVPVYIACGGTVDEAVDIMFSRKVLRKLEGLYDEDTKARLLDFSDYINLEYKMPITIGAIKRITEKI